MKNAGFTIIDLLLSIVIIGILAAIALPSFMRQAARARESEAKQYVAAVNRAQQIYIVEHQTFADSLANLKLMLPQESPKYVYAIVLGNKTGTIFTATSKDPQTKSFTGGAAFIRVDASVHTTACQSNPPVNDYVPSVVFTPFGVQCQSIDHNMN